MRHLRNAHSQSQSGSALLLLTSVQNLYVVNFKVKCKAVLKFKVKTACIMTFCCWYICSRDRPRFFDQVGHQTTNASIGNTHFFTK